ncbi:hypothetical protein RBU49_13425 [Clostridium sp. MB40-C1]|uniref:hypothetical protein n=1 Tax=Clostridium sp. MB40-C1 TaxID=3070996 RepID=UPI0027DFDAEE|nr:hypothetical protein [Clostridium sp. MB40-C1]WMJ79859.1 hypothetical protein RBU49_13425 [Clostridium sp. MB40-C1]
MDFKNVISKITKTTIDTAEVVAQTAKEGSAKIAKKSEELVEVSKLTVSINSEESKIKDIYTEIGKIVCEKHENGMYIDPDLVEQCNDVLDLKNKIREMKNRVIQIKNKKVCPECEETLNSETMFCPKCGTNIENDIDIEGSDITAENISDVEIIEDK